MLTNVNLPAAQLQIAMGVPLQCISEVRLYYGKSRYGTDKIPFHLVSSLTKIFFFFLKCLRLSETKLSVLPNKTVSFWRHLNSADDICVITAVVIERSFFISTFILEIQIHDFPDTSTLRQACCICSDNKRRSGRELPAGIR